MIRETTVSSINWMISYPITTVPTFDDNIFINHHRLSWWYRNNCKANEQSRRHNSKNNQQALCHPNPPLYCCWPWAAPPAPIQSYYYYYYSWASVWIFASPQNYIIEDTKDMLIRLITFCREETRLHVYIHKITLLPCTLIFS